VGGRPPPAAPPPGAPAARRLLRFSTTIANVGLGPFELVPRAEDCDGDGDPTNDRLAVQRVYLDADGNGVFDPSVDTAVEEEPSPPCFFFHLEHGHWHVDGFARYRLLRIRDGEIVAARSKVSFCAVDSLQVRPRLPGSPGTRGYGSCEKDATQGISVGWADLYGASLPGQSLRVTGVPAGRYCLEVFSDPLGRFVEDDDANNGIGVPIRLRRHAAHRLRGRC
jgi:hypothetical protein